MSKRKGSVVDFFSKASSKKSHAEPASSSSQCEPLLQQDDPASLAATTPVIKPDLDSEVAEDAAADVSQPIRLPTCWDQDHWLEFKNKYQWLFVENALLGCSVCREVKNLGGSSSQGVSISKEWSKGTITPYGKTRKDMLTALRKKIHIHKGSEAHVKATAIKAASINKILQSSIAEQQKLATTTKVFCTAYFCAETDRPFTDFGDLISLQVANGADLGCAQLHSERAATRIIDCIAGEMRKRLCEAIVEQAPKISVYIDEATTVCSHSMLMVYVRASVNGKEPVTFFLDSLDLPKTDAQSIEVTLLACLSKHGFTNGFLAENLIGVCSDGASVTLGRKSGVLERLGEKFPPLVKWHCLCYRLDSCVSDTIDAIPGLHHVTTFFEKLYAAYHQFPKNLSKLSECAKELERQVLQIGNVFSVRWVASNQQAIRAVWESYPALHRHFKKVSSSSAHSSRQRSLFGGLHEVLTSGDYLLNLAVVADAAQEIALLSEALQREDITLSRACQLIHRSVRAMEKLKDMHGKHLKEVMESLEKGNFKGVTINAESAEGQVRKNLPQFYQGLVDNLRSRLYTSTAGDEPAASAPSDEFKTLISELDILTPRHWPVNVDSPWFEGEAKLEQLCKRFRLNYASICEGFRDFIDNGGAAVPASLKPVMTAVNSLPLTSGDCETGFRTMNVVMSPIGSRLSAERLSSRLLVSLLGPPVSLWDPLPYVIKWLSTHGGAED